MPAYTLGEICSLVTQDIGRRADIALSVVSQRVNMAYEDVSYAVDHALQERIAISSTTSGENRIELPSDFREPKSLRLTVFSSQTTPATTASYKTLNLLSAHQLDGEWSDDIGEPQSYAFYNDWLELSPSPDSGYSLQLRYMSQVTDMLELTQVPSVDTEWRKAIKYRAETLMHEYLGNWPAAAASQQRYLSYVGSLKDSAAKRQSSQHRMSITPVYPRVTYS